MLRRKLIGILLVLVLFTGINFLYAATSSTTEDQNTVQDLTKAYEVWKGHGIKFVVRDEKGHFVTWNIGRLESWGSKSRWVIRDTKGHFLTYANGNVETWKNGMTRLVLRTPKGHLLTHIDINLTSKASFAQNVVGLRRLSDDNKFLGFVQETLTELLMKELKGNDTLRTKVLMDYIRTSISKPGMKNFIPVLKAVLQQLNFMASQNNDPVLKSLADGARELLKQL